MKSAVFILFVALATLSAAQNLAIPNADAYMRAGSGITCRFLNRVNCVATGALNEFGKDLQANNNVWTKALCQEDSDGDGLTNGQELGDPCCTWTASKPTSVRTAQLSHPGAAASTNTAPKDGCRPATCASTFTNANQVKCGRVLKEKFTVEGGKEELVVKVSIKKMSFKYKVKVLTDGILMIQENVRVSTVNDRRLRRSDPHMRSLQRGRKSFKDTTGETLDDMIVPPGKTDCCGKDAIMFKLTLVYCTQFVDDDCTGGKKTVTKTFMGKIKCGSICKNGGSPLPMTKTQKCEECAR